MLALGQLCKKGWEPTWNGLPGLNNVQLIVIKKCQCHLKVFSLLAFYYMFYR